MNQAKQNVEVLNNPNEIKILQNVLKTNVSACRSVGSSFIVQLSTLYSDLLALYGIVGNMVSQQVASQGTDNRNEMDDNDGIDSDVTYL
jgi:exportin-1